jgi:hydrogenase expression/formation protein HypC
LIKDANVGDYVLVHAGFAIQKYDPVDARITLKAWEELKNA